MLETHLVALAVDVVEGEQVTVHCGDALGDAPQLMAAGHRHQQLADLGDSDVPRRAQCHRRRRGADLGMPTTLAPATVLTSPVLRFTARTAWLPVSAAYSVGPWTARP